MDSGICIELRRRIFSGRWGRKGARVQISTPAPKSPRKDRGVSNGDAHQVEGAQKIDTENALLSAIKIWDRLECAVNNDHDDPIGGSEEDDIRYARNGRKFCKIALGFAAEEAKGRHRGEWRAYFYERKMGPKANSDERSYNQDMGERRREKKRRKFLLSIMVTPDR